MVFALTKLQGHRQRQRRSALKIEVTAKRQVGDDTFMAIMHEYVSQFRWGIATPDDLMSIAESVSGRDLDPLFNRWILNAQ